jgi:hypothetical protein
MVRASPWGRGLRRSSGGQSGYIGYLSLKIHLKSDFVVDKIGSTPSVGLVVGVCLARMY